MDRPGDLDRACLSRARGKIEDTTKVSGGGDWRGRGGLFCLCKNGFSFNGLDDAGAQKLATLKKPCWVRRSTISTCHISLDGFNMPLPQQFCSSRYSLHALPF